MLWHRVWAVFTFRNHGLIVELMQHTIKMLECAGCGQPTQVGAEAARVLCSNCIDLGKHFPHDEHLQFTMDVEKAIKPTRDLQEVKDEVRVCGVHELEVEILMAPASVVSIWDPDASDAEKYLEMIRRRLPRAPVLVEKFDDITASQEGRRLVSENDIRKILEFAKTAPLPVLVHCRAGVSRSTATAYAILCQLHGPGMEDACMELLAKIRPQAVPNESIVAIADKLLRRDGEMIRAYRDFMKRYFFGETNDATLSDNKPSP